jgi:aryl-alcohol dehydrogenase-like predicted oxidoreductase
MNNKEWTTSIEEVMTSLHSLVESGKVLYLGVSDTPAWIVSAGEMHPILSLAFGSLV